MRRTIATTGVMLVALVAMAATPTGAAASGGGGCGRAVSDVRGSDVHIKSFCFLPTILRIHPGQAVTFENRDGFAHTVLGANGVWGSFSQVRGHGAVTYRFTRPGVYPYVCTYHPGMVGAVVVGNGSAHGEATAAVTAAGPVVAVDAAVRRAPVATADTAGTPPMPASNRAAPWQLVALGAVLIAVVVLIGIERRRAVRRIAG
jgi:plastocyanin